MECYGIGEMPAPNHKGRRTSGGSHGDDTDSDGACLTGPQPYTGEETRVPPVCCRFPVSAGWNLERHARRKSDGRIPRPSGRGGGQSPNSVEDTRVRATPKNLYSSETTNRLIGSYVTLYRRAGTNWGFQILSHRYFGAMPKILTYDPITTVRITLCRGFTTVPVENCGCDGSTHDRR